MPFIIGAALILLAGGGYYAWTLYSETQTPVAEPVVETPVIERNVQYASTTMKFSLAYPAAFTLQESYAYTRVSPTKPIVGVKFLVPASFTEGTNLAPDSGVSVEQLPRAKVCTGDIFVKANVRTREVPVGTLTLSVATSTESIGADTFEEMVFAVASSSPCIAMRYFIHTTAVGTSTTAFDRSLLVAEFDKISQSLSTQ